MFDIFFIALSAVDSSKSVAFEWGLNEFSEKRIAMNTKGKLSVEEKA